MRFDLYNQTLIGNLVQHKRHFGPTLGAEVSMRDRRYVAHGMPQGLVFNASCQLAAHA